MHGCFHFVFAHFIRLFVFNWLYLFLTIRLQHAVRKPKIFACILQSLFFVPFARHHSPPPRFFCLCVCAKSSKIRVFCLLVATTYFSNFKNKQWFSEFFSFFVQIHSPVYNSFNIIIYMNAVLHNRTQYTMDIYIHTQTQIHSICTVTK